MNDEINPEDVDFGDFSEYEDQEIPEENVYVDETPDNVFGDQDSYADFDTFDTYSEGEDDGGGFSLPSLSGLSLGGENQKTVLTFSAVIILLLCCWVSSIPLVIYLWEQGDTLFGG